MSRFGSNQDACHSFTGFQRTSRRPQCRMISKSFVCLLFHAPFVPWWSLSGSNRRPPACKAGALPAELRPQGILGIMVGLGGLEPPASPLSGVRSNHLSYRPMEIEPPEPTPGCLELGSKRLFVKSPHTDVRSCSSRNGLRVKYRCLVWTSCEESSRPSFSKGGDPAAPSDTATLLRLHPSHEPLRGRRPPCG